jgi:nucleotide-binding universal stress UspA family protein
MTDFPTRILLATDGSEDAAFAARTAVNLANKTGSELHVVYVEEVPRRLSYSESPSLEEMIDPEFEEQMRKHFFGEGADQATGYVPKA